MDSVNNGSSNLGEGNSSLSQDPAQTITITIMEPSSALTDPVDAASFSAASTLNSNFSSVVSAGTETVLVVPRRGTTEREAASTVISEKPQHILQTSISKTQLEEEFPVISNISNPEEEESLGQGLPKESVIYGQEVDVTASSDPHCLVCNKELPQNSDDSPVAVFQVQTTATQRKMSVMLGVLVGQKITSRKSHSDLLCSRCYNLLDKVDSLEIELQDTKDDIINKFQSTYAIYEGRPLRKKTATAKRKEFVFPKIEPDEMEKEDSLELDSNFEPRAEDLLEEEADQQEDLVASGALDDEWEPEFKRQPKMLKRENTDGDGGVAAKRRRGRPRKDVTKAKEQKQESQGCPKDIHIEKSNSETNSEIYGTCNLYNKSKMNSKTKKIGSKRLSLYSSTLLKRKISGNFCPVCDKSFISEIETKDHFDSSHNELNEYTCCLCEKVISSNFQDILSHLRQFCRLKNLKRTEKLSELKFSFQVKQYIKNLQKTSEFFTEMDKKQDLVTHPSIIDSKKQISCPECEKCFSPINLKRHINDCHTKRVPYPCPECSAVYHDASNLLSHRKRNHFSGETRRHLCEVCGKKFIAPSDLKIHVMGVHQNIKKFICEFCGLSFKIASALTYHRRLHTGERPHVCNICGRAFTKPNAISKHMKNVHRVEYQGRYRKRLQKSASQVTSNEISQASNIYKEETFENTLNTEVGSIPESGLSMTGNSNSGMGVTTIYVMGEQMQFTSPTMMNVTQPLQPLSYYPDKSRGDDASAPALNTNSTDTADIIHIHIEPGIPQSDNEGNLTYISQNNPG